MASTQQNSSAAPKEEETEERLTEVEDTLSETAPLVASGHDVNCQSMVNMAVHRYFDALGAQDVPAILELYADDGIFFPHNLCTAKGKDALRQTYTDIFQMIKLDVEPTVESTTLAGDTAIVVTSSLGTVHIIEADIDVPEENREIFHMRNIDGAWRIASYMFNKKAAPPAPAEPVVYLDADSPFYHSQPTTEIAAVFERESAKLREIFGASLLEGPVHVGSSAIIGMPGSPIVDMAVTIASLPPPPEFLAALEDYGYDYRGPSPHDRNDHWANGGEGRKGHLGRVVLHVSAAGSGFLADARAFVDFCNSDDGERAFNAYSRVKLEGVELATGQQDGGERANPHRVYKIHKAKVVREVLEQARAWARRAERDDDGAPPAWAQVWDPDRRAHYYVKQSTQEVTWDAPPAGARVLARQEPSAMKDRDALLEQLRGSARASEAPVASKDVAVGEPPSAAPKTKRGSIRGMRKSMARATNLHHFFTPAPPSAA